MSTPFGAILNMPEPEDDMARRGAEPEEWHCPYCGESAGEPREFWGERSMETGDLDYAECCSLCLKGER